MLSFKCPKCRRFCAVVEEYAGRRVRCTHCSCRFIVPGKPGEKAQIYVDPPEPPLPGFYRAIFVDGWKGLFVKDSIVGLVFCLAMTVFQFYLGDLDYSFSVTGASGGGFRPPLIVGWITQFFTLGGLCWYYFQIIGATAMYPESLPELDIGFGFEYLGNLIKSIYLFIVAAFLSLIPSMAVAAWLESLGIVSMWIRGVLMLTSGFLFGLILAIFGMDTPPWVAVFRPDVLIRTITKTFWPYLVTTVIADIAFVGWFFSLFTFATSKDITTLKTVLFLIGRLAAVLGMLYAMRVIGLYCRHYKRVCPWLWTIQNRDGT